MLIDHIAWILIPQASTLYLIMRMIGRIAAPIFIYCFVVGFKHTSNRKQYQKRLAISAGLMCILNCILVLFQNEQIKITAFAPNMFFTFLVLSVVIECFEKTLNSRDVIAFLFGLLLSFIAVSKVEYGIIAVMSALIFYFITNKVIRNVLFVCVSILLCIIIQNMLQVFMVLSMLFIACDTEKKPEKSNKYFFYWFYPGHILLLSMIALLV